MVHAAGMQAVLNGKALAYLTDYSTLQYYEAQLDCKLVVGLLLAPAILHRNDAQPYTHESLRPLLHWQRQGATAHAKYSHSGMLCSTTAASSGDGPSSQSVHLKQSQRTTGAQSGTGSPYLHQTVPGLLPARQPQRDISVLRHPGGRRPLWPGQPGPGPAEEQPLHRSPQHGHDHPAQQRLRGCAAPLLAAVRLLRWH